MSGVIFSHYGYCNHGNTSKNRLILKILLSYHILFQPKFNDTPQLKSELIGLRLGDFCITSVIQDYLLLSLPNEVCGDLLFYPRFLLLLLLLLLLLFFFFFAMKFVRTFSLNFQKLETSCLVYSYITMPSCAFNFFYSN